MHSDLRPVESLVRTRSSHSSARGRKEAERRARQTGAISGRRPKTFHRVVARCSFSASPPSAAGGRCALKPSTLPYPRRMPMASKIMATRELLFTRVRRKSHLMTHFIHAHSEVPPTCGGCSLLTWVEVMHSRPTTAQLDSMTRFVADRRRVLSASHKGQAKRYRACAEAMADSGFGPHTSPTTNAPTPTLSSETPHSSSLHR